MPSLLSSLNLQVQPQLVPLANYYYGISMSGAVRWRPFFGPLHTVFTRVFSNPATDFLAMDVRCPRTYR